MMLPTPWGGLGGEGREPDGIMEPWGQTKKQLVQEGQSGCGFLLGSDGICSMPLPELARLRRILGLQVIVRLCFKCWLIFYAGSFTPSPSQQLTTASISGGLQSMGS